MTKDKMGWPANNKPAQFELLVSSCKKALEQGIKWERINPTKSIKWTGPLSAKSQLVTTLDFPEMLRAKNLLYNEGEQGRDVVDVILGIAIRLGIEQGRRIVVSELHPEQKLLGRIAEFLAL